ncbi:MAG TPA: dUTP diphosphatase [Methylovirgula sp.]|jgi:dUTP pyrophosphatase|nr:dUTP diphosphatase [Methylovirgula sp.]
MADAGATVAVSVRQLPHGVGLPLPAYQSAGAAGVDLLAALAPDSKIVIEPGARHLVETGIALQIPHGYEAQIRPRSGLALQYGVTVLNAPGTIDSDYRGEISVLLVNLGSEPFELRRGVRIAQMIVAPVVQASLTLVSELEASERGVNGFGSTGLTSLLEKDG